MFDPFEEAMIKSYFSLPDTINRLQRYRQQVHQAFYLQTMATRLEYGALGVYTVGFRPDIEIGGLYERLDLIDCRISRNQFRCQHFKAYLDYLPISDVKRLKSKYIALNDVCIAPVFFYEVIHEIQEIEAAPEYLLKLGRLYFKAQCGDEVTFTRDQDQARCFDQSSKEGERLKQAFDLKKAKVERWGD